MKVCSIEGCGGTFKVTAGLCNKHYIRMRRHGSPTAGGTERGSVAAFFDAHVDYQGDDCVIWPFSRDGNGYARMRHNGRNEPAHRLMCIRAHGEPSEPRNHATHKCGRGADGCINPRHLEWGTPFKNQQDRVRHGTSNRGERCAAHRLKAEQVETIFSRLQAGERPYLLAREYGVHDVTILDIKIGRSWAWLTGLRNPKERDIDGNLVAANDNEPQRRVAA